MYQKLRGEAGFANLLTSGKVPHYSYITISLLGPSLARLNMNNGRPFGLSTVEKIGQKMIQRFESLYECGIVHCDIKPENITIGLEDTDEIYLIDFGLARDIENKENQEPIKIDRIPGSLMYLSLGAHEGILSFRNDLESMGYLLLFLLNGDLPWSVDEIVKIAKIDNMMTIMDAVKSLKKSFMKDLPKSLPAQIYNLLEAIHGISYVEPPDYEMLKNILM